MTEQDSPGKIEIKTQPPPFRIIRLTEEEALNHCFKIKADIDKRENRYEPSYPSEEPLDLFFKNKISDGEFKDRFKLWFKEWNIDEQVKQLETCESTFQKGIAKYLPLQEWGFRIPNQYTVIVTPCAVGAGGAGEWESKWGPIITMYYARDWSKGPRTPEETLLHEAYHLGIDGIINKLGFEQSTKERIVDWCCREVLVPDVLPTYFMQLWTDRTIDPYLEAKGLSVYQRLSNYYKARSQG